MNSIHGQPIIQSFWMKLSYRTQATEMPAYQSGQRHCVTHALLPYPAFIYSQIITTNLVSEMKKLRFTVLDNVSGLRLPLTISSLGVLLFISHRHTPPLPRESKLLLPFLFSFSVIFSFTQSLVTNVVHSRAEWA